MPDKTTIEKAEQDKAEGKSPSTQAGEFVHDEIKKIRKGKHGARSPKQAIAIGLSEARRAGVKLPPYKGRKTTKARPPSRPSAKRSAAISRALKREPTSTVSRGALAKQAHEVAKRRGPSK